jgi:RNA-directed DNA polymerase
VVQGWTAEAGLGLHPTKTRVVNAAARALISWGIRSRTAVAASRDKSLKKFKDTVRDKTKRTAGHSLSRIIGDLNPMLRGWSEYFKHSHRSTFALLDGWIRRRLRNILRKQHRRPWISRGFHNIRWPNAFFAEHGLFNLHNAYAQVRQSSCR